MPPDSVHEAHGGSPLNTVLEPVPHLSTPPDPRLLRRMERTGWGLFVVWAPSLILWGVLDPDPYANGWQLVLELAFVGGRAVNISHGVAYGYSTPYLVFQCGLQDIIYTLVLYPWIIRAYFGFTKLDFAARTLDSLRKAAERKKGLLEPFGAVGLWLFVAFPFWSTGVVNGATLGFLLGMRTRLTLAVVFSAHLTSMGAMLIFFEAIRGPMESLGEGALSYLPWIVLATLLVMLVIQQLVLRVRRFRTR